jgi:hypothetical protein
MMHVKPPGTPLVRVARPRSGVSHGEAKRAPDRHLCRVPTPTPSPRTDWRGEGVGVGLSGENRGLRHLGQLGKPTLAESPAAAKCRDAGV